MVYGHDDLINDVFERFGLQMFRGLAVVDGAVSDAGKNQISVEETKLVQIAVELLVPFRLKTTGVF